ncbi:TPA: hypothetical protein ONC52_001058 [Enterobacter asburiae]|nr:hypothetical protein [Enterobacter asburiae]HCR2222314.1 hypothetical protein [Enterobacter asburiae]HDX3905074.1 hypothetical protein [Enterobacter asburiae]
MFTNFLLTYSVRAQTSASSDKEKADSVRDEIADLDVWTKLETVETTFAGKMYVTGLSVSDKKKKAVANVEEVFLPILKKHSAYSYDVQITCALLTGNIEQPFEFVVKN